MTEIRPVDGGLFVVENSHQFDDCIAMIEGVEAVKVPGWKGIQRHPRSNDPPWMTDEAYLARMREIGRVAPSRATHIDWEDAPGFAASRGSRLLTATGSYRPGDLVGSSLACCATCAGRILLTRKASACRSSSRSGSCTARSTATTRRRARG